MKKLLIRFCLFVLVAALVASCKPSVEINSTTYDKTVHFPDYKTFSMITYTPQGEVNIENLKHIENSVKEELTKKGFKETNSNPDMVVNIKTVMKKRQTRTTKTSYSNTGESLQTMIYWSQYGSAAGETTVEESNLKDGSLVVDVLDAETKRRVWQGTVNTEISKAPKDPRKVISATINKMMAGFPAK